MKKLLLLSFLSFGTLHSALSQDEAPKGSTIALITVAMGNFDLFKELGPILTSNGYEIKFCNKDMGIIQTEYRTLKGSWMSRYTFCVRGGLIQMIGSTMTGVTGVSPVINIGMKGSLNKLGFEEMVRLAKLIPSQRIEFASFAVND